jgi:hypothetical protein
MTALFWCFTTASKHLIAAFGLPLPSHGGAPKQLLKP